ncbi:hypothetical protein ACTFIR_004883 [Dictyostelium discoideum]
MKKIINNPQNVVSEMIDGFTQSSRDLLKLKGNFNVVVRSDYSQIKDRVALISGGGSGHEPAHIGYIGNAMLTGAVCGDVFASPSAKQIFMAIKSVAGKMGCILIVKNYMGDNGSFSIAREMCKSQLADIRVEIITVDDDISSILMKSDEFSNDNNDNIQDIRDKYKSITNRRGIAGTVLVHKILGGLAEQGKSIDEILKFYNKYISPSKSLNLVTMGVGLSSCIIPSVGSPSFTLNEKEMEIGLGIHGEFGIEKVELKSSKQIIKSLIDNLLKILPYSNNNNNINNNNSCGVAGGSDGEDKSLIVLINNLGSTTNMEMAIATNDCLNYLHEKGFTVERLITGTLMTSLEMAGISISLLLIKNNQIINLIDLQTNAMGWPNSVLKPYKNKEDSILTLDENDSHEIKYDNLKSITISKENGEILKEMVLLGCNSLIDNSSKLTDLDKQVGDGDLGTTLENLSKSIKKSIDTIPFDKPCYTFRKISLIIQELIGGSSGLFYSIFFLRLSNSLYERSTVNGKNQISTNDWGLSLIDAVNAIKELGKADIGDCTMLDSLIPAINKINQCCKDNENSSSSFDLLNTLKLASKEAQLGSESTIEMIAKKGRSSYLGERTSHIMDPGAHAIEIIFKSFLSINK